MGYAKGYSKMLKLGMAVVVGSLTINMSWFGDLNLALAQTQPQVSPLEITTPDPLLPDLSGDRSLSAVERLRLEQELAKLNAEATALFNSGKQDEAFTIWYRELRLRRFLGIIEEVNSLARVGVVAWNNTRKRDVQIITQRLETIQQEAAAENQLTPELLTALGVAYEQIRVPKQALSVYEIILQRAREVQDRRAIATALQTIGKLNLTWFNYSQAAQAYEELLNLTELPLLPLEQLNYLEQLAFIYQQAKEPEKAIPIQEQLAEIYQGNQQLVKLAELKISLANNYRTINQPEQASKNYREAFDLAWALQQFAYARNALNQLAQLYAAYDETDYAIAVYQELIKVEQQSYDFYNLMNTYDQLAQIYFQQKNYTQALAMLQEGLKIAEMLGYQEAYFQTQIERVPE
ncbi:tetratricopeptide repeat protein [Oscillatoria salina]|nr:tetratricopeptide repeat protein [Oscillatoria salina IIICB1]NET86718.1 tetratricopeptide repeat protein [Kamptonema sp. SIO1D9]